MKYRSCRPEDHKDGVYAEKEKGEEGEVQIIHCLCMGPVLNAPSKCCREDEK